MHYSKNGTICKGSRLALTLLKRFEVAYNLGAMTPLNSVGQRLLTNLMQVAQREVTDAKRSNRAEKVNVVGAGGTLTAAYEQLRNAAENAEEHLLLQNAVRRFYKRLFVTRDESQVRTSGNELAVELTFAGYIPNNSLTRAQIEEISRLAAQHYGIYEALHQERTISMDAATRWILDTLSVRVASVVDNRDRTKVFVEVAYAYFDTIIPGQLRTTKFKSVTEYQAPLLAVIHKALLNAGKSAGLPEPRRSRRQPDQADLRHGHRVPVCRRRQAQHERTARNRHARFPRLHLLAVYRAHAPAPDAALRH